MNTPAAADIPRLVFRIRNAGDIIICDYCKNYKCPWLDYSPANYPRRCPGTKEFWIADTKIDKKEFQRRTALARQIGTYLHTDRSWHLDAKRTKGMSAAILGKTMAEINSWSAKNKFTLSDMVEYVPSKDPRTTVQETIGMADSKDD
jgi:hypothetical protein